MQNQINHSHLKEKIKAIRDKSLLKSMTYHEDQLIKPISYWIKEDRMLSGRGKEFTIILRTRGCKWALSDSGGCSMCGYIHDCAVNGVNAAQIINQIEYAFERKREELSTDDGRFIIKIFNSGSFFDDSEVTEEVREFLYDKIVEYTNIEEIVLESRVEFVNLDKLQEIKEKLGDRYIELAIGLETANDQYRNDFINKNLNYNDFLNTIQMCKENGIGVRCYLLFKPPFVSEQGAIDDCVHSIKKLIDLGINTISINPMNIQRGSFVEYLWYQNRYRPPWFYSLFKALKLSIDSNETLKNVRILSDPSGSGTKRGIHNCLRRECNGRMNEILRNFVLSQNIQVLFNLDEEESCDCLTHYRLQKQFT